MAENKNTLGNHKHAYVHLRNILPLICSKTVAWTGKPREKKKKIKDIIICIMSLSKNAE